MRPLALLALLGLMLSATGCSYYSAPVMPPGGLFYTNIQAPVDTDVQSNPVGAKVGSSSSSSILGLFAFGDASLASAVQNGGLTKVDHVDYEFFNLLFIYQKFTINAHGE